MEEEDPPFSDEVLNALLARFVDSTLSELRRQHYPPHGTELLAKQLEAVAWLYYRHFHRLFPSLDYYDPGEFCRKILILRCGLDNYLDKENGLIESRVKLASRTADYSSGACKIIRVAVLLLSKDRTRCFIVKSLITEGHWSLIESEVQHGEPLMEAALLATQKISGFESSSLEVETKVYQTRCMSQTGDFTRLYVMILKGEAECNGSQTSWISLEELLLHVNSGWLKKSWEWEATPAMDYFHVQPFLNALSDISNRNSERTSFSKPANVSVKLNTFVEAETLDSHNDKMEWSSSDVVQPSSSRTFSSCKRKVDEMIQGTKTQEEPKIETQEIDNNVAMIVVDSEDEDEEKVDLLKQSSSINQVLQQTQNHCSHSSTATKSLAETGPSPPASVQLETKIDEKQDSPAVQTQNNVLTPARKVIKPLVFSTPPEKTISSDKPVVFSTPAKCIIDDEASEVSALLLCSMHQQQRIQKLTELTSTFQSQTADYNAKSVALHKELVEGEAELQNSIRKLETKKIFSETSFLAHLPDPVKELEVFCSKNQWLKPRYEIQTAPFKSTQYVYTVTVHLSGRGIQHTEKGSSGTELHSAKQSAAAAMLGHLYFLKSKAL